MDSLFQNQNGEDNEHPRREMLLLFVDGELSTKEFAQLETHLEACWPCRVRTKRIQEAIADIIEFDETAVTPRLTPPQNWRNFDRQLRNLASQGGRPSWWSRLFTSLGRFLPVTRLAAITPEAFTPLTRLAVAVLAVIVIVTLVVQFRREPTVSAAELLRYATEAQAARIRETTQAVIHQRLQLRRKTQNYEEMVRWETWNDTASGRFVQTCDGCSAPDPVKTKTGTQSPDPRHPAPNTLLAALNGVLVANQMDPRHPLSATSFQSWRNTLQQPLDEVLRAKHSDGIDVFTLRTVAARPLKAGQIVEAAYVVRASDWQPRQLRLTVEAEGGHQTYELTANVSEVVSLSQIDPKIFVTTPAAAVSGSPSTNSSSPTTDAEPASSLTPVTPATASSDLEVEALRLLQQAGADLGEQVTVTRSKDGILHISGIVETEARKAEIIRALSSIAGHPAVRIEIQTVAEAVAAQRQTKPTPLPSQRGVQIAGNTMAAEPELRAYFNGKSNDVDQAVRQYAARMVNLSNRGMDHLWAMKRLLSQFSVEELRALTPEARAKWLTLIRAHAHSYRQANETLRRELQPVFFSSQTAGPVTGEGTIADMGDLAHAIEDLFIQGAANDRVVRSAFASSSGGAMTTAIRTPQFWQSLKNAESLAAKIDRAQ